MVKIDGILVSLNFILAKVGSRLLHFEHFGVMGSWNFSNMICSSNVFLFFLFLACLKVGKRVT
jgi:hypothetical protein